MLNLVNAIKNHHSHDEDKRKSLALSSTCDDSKTKCSFMYFQIFVYLKLKFPSYSAILWKILDEKSFRVDADNFIINFLGMSLKNTLCSCVGWVRRFVFTSGDIWLSNNYFYR